MLKEDLRTKRIRSIIGTTEAISSVTSAALEGAFQSRRDDYNWSSRGRRRRAGPDGQLGASS